ncbi:MAG: hypothetical protein IJ748_03085 [Bacteroidales bacterium]|nr:hypothetical protein [Bacteroidales bacterium]
MKRKITILFFALLSLFLSAQQPSKEERVKLFVASLMRDYPKATLQDIYKTSFQDTFGPEHLVENPQSVINYLKKEMPEVKNTFPYYEFCGLDGNFVRVHLSVIKDSIVSLETLADAFVRSSKMINKNITLKDWLEDWRERCGIISQMNIELVNYEEDSLFVENLIKKGHYAWVHSPAYRENYHPHYRIIQKDIFFEEIFPLIHRKQNEK